MRRIVARTSLEVSRWRKVDIIVRITDGTKRSRRAGGKRGCSFCLPALIKARCLREKRAATILRAQIRPRVQECARKR